MKNNSRISFWRLAAVTMLLVLAGKIGYEIPAVQRVFYPMPHKEIIFQQANTYGVDPFLVAAIIRTESKFWVYAESQQGAKGLMQLMPSTAEWIATQIPIKNFSLAMLYEPQTNIKMGCWYIANLKKEFGENQVLMIAAYNGGRGNVQQWLKSNQWSGGEYTVDNIPFAETREYIKRVLGAYEKYKNLYEKT